MIHHLESYDTALKTAIRKESLSREKRDTTSRDSKLQQLKRARTATLTTLRHLRSKRGAALLLTPIFFGLGALVDYILNRDDASAEDVNKLFNVVANQQLQITSLQVQTEKTRKAVNTMLLLIPQLTKTLKTFMTYTELVLQENAVDDIFANVNQALTDGLMQYTFALETAKQGRCTSPLFSSTEANMVGQYAKAHYDYDIDTDLSHVITRVTEKNQKVTITYAFLIKDKKRQITIHEVTAIPHIIDGTRFTIVPISTYVGFMKHSVAFTVLTPTEATQCIATPRNCQLTHPIYNSVDNICGVSSFFGKDPNCPTVQSHDLSDFFYTVGNKTVYSVYGDGILHTHCPASDGPGTESTIKLSGHGFFYTLPGCYNTYGTLTIYPSNVEEHKQLGNERFKTYAPAASAWTATVDNNVESYKHLNDRQKDNQRELEDSIFTTIPPPPAIPQPHFFTTHAVPISGAAIGLVVGFFLLVITVYYCNRLRARYHRDIGYPRDYAGRVMNAVWSRATPNCPPGYEPTARLIPAETDAEFQTRTRLNIYKDTTRPYSMSATAVAAGN